MYKEMIEEVLTAQGFAGKYQPRHIEAWMRLELGTLDWISRDRFNSEVSIARECCDADLDASESLAVSFGL